MTLAGGDGMRDRLDAVLAREIDRRKTDRRWTPLPHQVPPVGEWLGWLLMAGRGAGKTEGCAKYMNDHVNGPPCLTGHVPHWMAIIAPTLGDAATACYSGPSGIRAFNDTVVMSSKVGGLLLTWPNGAQAKMYGAREPDDVERLRAGGNVCLAAGTLVRTEHGEVPIEHVRANDRVWTRRGLRRVLKSGMTRSAARVWKLVTDHGTLIATGDHEVATHAGTVEIQFLQPNDRVLAWPTASSTMAFTGTNDRQSIMPIHGGGYCIGTSGHNTLDPYRKSVTSIIALRMTTLLPTSLDLSASHRNNTSIITTITGTRRQSHKQARRHGQDESTPLEGVRFATCPCDHAGCVCDVRAEVLDVLKSYCGETTYDRGHVKNVRASSVTARSSPQSVGQHRHVQHVAGVSTLLKSDVLVDRHTRNGCGVCARSVELGLSDPPSIHEVSPVQARVLRVYATNDVASVYDLLVEHDHEFVANGLVVMNCLAWCEELAAWRYMQDAFDQMRFGLRVGKHPRWIASTTPKPRALIKKLYKGEVRGVIVTHATMYDNPHLPSHIKDALEEAYSGSSLGSQELLGKLVEQDTNALWARDTIERTRLTVAPSLRTVEVGVDPSGGAGEQGIVVVGRADLPDENDGEKGRILKHGFVLADATVHMKPEGWARTAITTAVDWEADRIVVETNFGGDQAVALLVNAADNMGVSVPIRTVHASRGKQPRAQPVSAMSVQNRWHLVGRFDELEDQMCTWTVDAGWSPDRIDAMVWPAWSMKLVSTIFRAVGTWGGSQMVKRTLERRRAS